MRRTYNCEYYLHHWGWVWLGTVCRLESEDGLKALNKLGNDYVNFCKECCMYASVRLLTPFVCVHCKALDGYSATSPAQKLSSSTRSTTANYTPASLSSPSYISQILALKMYPSGTNSWSG